MNEQPDAEPKGIDLDDADRAYDKWAEHRNGQSRLDAFRAGVEFGLRHTAPSRPDASGLIEAADLSDVGLFPYQDQDEHTVVLYFNTNEAATRYGEYLKELLRPPPPPLPIGEGNEVCVRSIIPVDCAVVGSRNPWQEEREMTDTLPTPPSYDDSSNR